MSINVSTSPRPNEVFVLTSENVSIKLTNVEDKTSIATTGSLYLSSSRIVLAAKPVTYRIIGKGDREFKSLSANVIDKNGGIRHSRLVQPWFGPNKWEALLIPDASRTFEPHCPWILSLAFNSGGAFEFTQKFASFASAASQAHQEGIDELLPPYVP